MVSHRSRTRKLKAHTYTESRITEIGIAIREESKIMNLEGGRDRKRNMTLSTFVSYHDYPYPYPSSRWWEQVDRSPLQEEANLPDFAVVAVAALGVNSWDSSFLSQVSDAVTTPVRSYQSLAQQPVAGQDRKSGSTPS